MKIADYLLSNPSLQWDYARQMGIQYAVGRMPDGHMEETAESFELLKAMKQRLRDRGYVLLEEEPLKLTVDTAAYGYTGSEYTAILRQEQIVCELADDTHAVMMLTPEIGVYGLQLLENAMTAIPARQPLSVQAPAIPVLPRVMSIRQAIFAPHETVSISESLGRVCASPTVSCPPAIPIAVSGERIGEAALALFCRYGLSQVDVVKQEYTGE